MTKNLTAKRIALLLSLSCSFLEIQHCKISSYVYKPIGQLKNDMQNSFGKHRDNGSSSTQAFSNRIDLPGVSHSCKYKLKEKQQCNSLLIYISLIAVLEDIKLNFTGCLPNCLTVVLGCNKI